MKMFLNKKELEDLVRIGYETMEGFSGNVEARVAEDLLGKTYVRVSIDGVGIRGWRCVKQGGEYEFSRSLNSYMHDGVMGLDHHIEIALKFMGFKMTGNPKYKFDYKEFYGVEIELENKNKKKEGIFSMKNLKMYEGCLIVVDMVNGFVREGVLHDEKIADIIPRQIELIKEAKHDGKLIVFIKDTHDKDAVEFERFGNTKHCVEGEAEAELVDELKKFENLENAISIPKNSTCFMEAPLFRDLMEFQKDMNDFDIVGCCTDICVVNGAIALANYLDQNNRKHNIRVHEDAIATYAEDDRGEYVEAAKILMKQQGIELVKKGR